MSPTLSRSSALQRVKLGDALEIRDGIIFNFYPGLPHVLCVCFYVGVCECVHVLVGECVHVCVSECVHVCVGECVYV